LKISRKEANDTSAPSLHLEVERSMVKVTRPINAETEMRHIFGMREGLQASNLVHGWSTMTRTTDLRGDLKGQRSNL